MGMLKEFKDFAVKGNLVDIAVGFVMGAAFNKVVSSFTGGIITPLIGLLFDTNFREMKYVLSDAVVAADGTVTTPENAILYGDFFTNVLDFIIVAFVMFLIVKAVNNMKKPVEEAPAGPTQEELLAQIRDLLKKCDS